MLNLLCYNGYPLIYTPNSVFPIPHPDFRISQSSFRTHFGPLLSENYLLPSAFCHPSSDLCPPTSEL